MSYFSIIFLTLSLAVLNRSDPLPICTYTNYKQNSDGTVPSCSNTFGCMWDLSQCTQCKSNECSCQTYNSCDSCVDQKFYNPQTQNCDPCPLNCKHCCRRKSIMEYTCSECLPGFQLIGGACRNVTGCKKLLPNSDKCLECSDGYYLDKDLKCQACDFKCSKCLTKYDCITCSARAYSVNGLCKDCCDSNNTDIPLSCASYKCDYVPPVVVPVCQQPTDPCIENGYNYQENQCLCTKCKPGYYLNMIAQKPSTSECLKCDEHTQRCVQIFSYKKVKKTIECEDQYILDLKDNTCVSNQKDANTSYNCRRMYNRSCSDCFDGYYPEIDESGKYLCFKNQVSDSCDIPTEKGQKCSVCKLMYYLDSNKQCQSCNPSCNKDECKICLKCDADKCTKCKEGYRLKDKVCSKCSNQNCSACDQLEKICTKCKKGYGLNSQAKSDDDQCIKCQDNCEVCDIDFRKCTKCTDDTYNLDYVCKPKPANCVQHQNGFCIQCAYGYIAEGGYCLKCANEDTGIFNCPSSCSDSEIALVDLLHSTRILFLIYQFIFILLATSIISSFQYS